jgi:hypothetical protein
MNGEINTWVSAPVTIVSLLKCSRIRKEVINTTTIILTTYVENKIKNRYQTGSFLAKNMQL